MDWHFLCSVILTCHMLQITDLLILESSSTFGNVNCEFSSHTAIRPIKPDWSYYAVLHKVSQANLISPKSNSFTLMISLVAMLYQIVWLDIQTV